jgi:hypothetical protein
VLATKQRAAAAGEMSAGKGRWRGAVGDEQSPALGQRRGKRWRAQSSGSRTRKVAMRSVEKKRKETNRYVCKEWQVGNFVTQKQVKARSDVVSCLY